MHSANGINVWFWLAGCALIGACFSAKTPSVDPELIDDEPVVICDERSSRAGDRLRQAAGEADGSCSSDADCEAVLSNASCNAQCLYAFVSSAGRAEIESTKRSVDADLCAHEAGAACIPTSPYCGKAPAAWCKSGKCTADLLGESTQCSTRRAESVVAYRRALEAADKSCTVDADCEIVSTRVNCYDYCEHTAALSSNARETFQAAVAGINREQCVRYAADGCLAPFAHECQPTDAEDVACIRGACQRGPNPDSLPGCVTCLEEPLEWGYIGGLFSDAIVSRIDTCVRYSRTRLSRADGSLLSACKDDLVACDAAVSGSALSAALADAQVQRAFDQGLMTFGVDGRASDGQVFSIKHGTKQFNVGPPCSGNHADCQQVPPEVQALADLLRRIDLFEDQGACAGFEPD